MLRLQVRFALMQQQYLTHPAASFVTMVILNLAAPPSPRAMLGRGADLSACIFGGIVAPPLLTYFRKKVYQDEQQSRNHATIKRRVGLRLKGFSSDVL